MDLSKINDVGIFNVVLNQILDIAHYDQQVVGPETLLDDIGISETETLKKLAEDLTASVPLFTDVMATSYNSWKTVYDVYKTIERLNREGIENPSISHSHRAKKE